MSRFTSFVHVLPLVVGILSGCTTLVTSYNRIRAGIMNAGEPKEESQNYYGAFFISPAFLTRERPNNVSEPKARSSPIVLSLKSPQKLRQENINP